MIKSIFTPFQKGIFKIISQNNFVTKNFYFSGGTALSEFYLKHRYSEDFDFFTAKKISYEKIKKFLESDIKKNKVQIVDYQMEEGADIFFLKKKNKEIIKIQFCYYPFKIIKNPVEVGLLKVDSLLDITVNKLDTIITRGLARDFVDFYFIQKEKNYSLKYLLNCIRKKFFWPVDPLFFASSLIKVKEVSDYPKMIRSYSKEKMIKYFLDLAKGQKKNIFI